MNIQFSNQSFILNRDFGEVCLLMCCCCCGCFSMSPVGQQSSQILYTKGAAPSASSSSPPSSLPQGVPESRPSHCRPAAVPCSPSHSQAAMRAREFAADLFRRAQGGGQGDRRTTGCSEKEPNHPSEDKGNNAETFQEADDCKGRLTSSPPASSLCGGVIHPLSIEPVLPPAPSSSLHPSTSAASSSQDSTSTEPGYVNYSRLHYRLQQPGAAEQPSGGEEWTDGEVEGDGFSRFSFFLPSSSSVGYEDDKVQLAFTVTDLKGRNLQLVTGPHDGQVSVCRTAAEALLSLVMLKS